jgi:hypothetical protein
MIKVFLLALLCFIGGVACAQVNQDALVRLNEALAKKRSYVSEKEQTILKLKRRLQANPKADLNLQFEINDALYQQYRSFIYDSAFAYAKKLVSIGYKLNDRPKIGYAKTQMGFTTLSAGMFKETFDTLNTVHVSELNDSTKLEYYSLMARTLYDNCDYNKDSYYCDIYVGMADKYVEFATRLAGPNSYNFLYLNGLHQLRNQRTDEAVNYLNRLMNGDIKLTNHQFAIATSTLSYLHLRLGDTTRAINLLVDACIMDVNSATKETLALTRLAELLYASGQVEDAYNYINQSMEDANFYGAKQRKSEVGAILPIIASARLSYIDGQRKTLLWYSIGLTILSVLTILFAWSTFSQSRKLRKKDKLIQQTNDNLKQINHKLTEANKIKEEYLGYYFNINSEYIEKIEKFKRSVDQKLIQKKYEDIRFVMSRIDLKKEREELYYSFDKVFLKLFPDFVSTFNSYFREEDRIKLENDQLLNTELRIFALIRMGVSDSDKLAKILGYSVNTIYSYKNRIKSKAIVPNEEFERKIMEIQAI